MLTANHVMRLKTSSLGELYQTLGLMLERGEAQPTDLVITEVGLNTGKDALVGRKTLNVRAGYGQIVISADERGHP